MFHKIKDITALPDQKLSVQFAEGVTKIYDTKPLKSRIPAFAEFDARPELFEDAQVDVGGCGVIWNDDIDLSSDELWDHGDTVKTPFDGLMALSDATVIWGLNESTLRKAIIYGKLINGIDVCKYGKQWVVSTASMIREYGEP